MSFARSCRRFGRVLRTPSQWPLAKLGAVGVGVGALVVGGCEAERRRLADLARPRAFNPGSPLQSIEGSLRTGDVLLFNRPLMAPAAASVHPVRCALVLMQKLHGRCEYDHVGVIIKRHDYPYVLERCANGRITLRPFEQRVLHSSAKEIVLRRLNAPDPTEADEQRVEAWIDRIMGEPAHSDTPRPLPVISSGPRIAPMRLLAHLAAAYLVPSFASTSLQRSHGLANLGHLLELSSELRALDERISELAIASSISPDALPAVSSLTGSTSPIERLQVRRSGVQARFDDILESFEQGAEESTSTADPTADLTRATDFPSATLAVQALQTLGVLPSRSVDGAPFVLTSKLSVPASRIPPSSAYPTRQFLSSSSLPLAYRPPLPPGAPKQEQADCFLEREMFIKSKNRPLTFVLEEY